MWQQYRRTMIPVQILILIVCGYFVYFQQLPVLLALLCLAIPMELAAFIGAAWSSRLKRKWESDRRGLLL